MSLTLGDKLKQARDARGITVSEVAEQTRISRQYLECIENNDYRTLPGGIFNKGFVKSYAKYVGIDEQEALQDYSKLVSEQGESMSEEVRTYRPEVLTDDRSTSSMLPTLIFAAIILGLLSWGIISLVSYLNAPRDVAANTSTTNKAATSANNNSTSNVGNSNSNTSNTATQAPINTNELAIQFKSISTEPEKPNLVAYSDGQYESYTFQGDEAKVYNPKQTFSVRFSKYQTPNLQLTVNGKAITLPTQPLTGKGQGIIFEINKGNIAQILQAGAITAESVASSAPNANVANTAVANRAVANTAVANAKPR
jgi:cytoskeletal protein RodZ